MKLNLGCGKKHLQGFLNVDAQQPADEIVNLDAYPWPWKNNTADEIIIEHCLEHLAEPLKAINEIHRIAKPDALITIRVPHYSTGGYNFTHKSFWSVDAFSFEGLTVGLFFVDYRRLKWLRYGFKQRRMYYPLFFVAPLVECLANLNVGVSERFFCYWLGGFEEIEFKLRAMK